VTRVDALVVNWETRDSLLECVAALHGQRGVDVRVIIVDNASSDGSADAVAERFPSDILVRQPFNAGYTAATNVGLQLCTADWILLCNPDCRAEPGTVAALVALVERTPTAAAASPILVGADGERQRFAYRFPTLVDAFFCYTHVGRRLDLRLARFGERRYSPERLRWVRTATAVDHPGAACLLLRRSVIGDGLDPGFPLFFSDAELCWQLRAHGLTLYIEPAASARHLQGESVYRLHWRLVLHELQRSIRRFYRLHHGPLRRGALTLLLVADCLATATVSAARRRSPAEFVAEIRLLRRLLAGRPAPGSPWREESPE
jgi:N-acetylglucosaminyl-diphospho-decaprenol L-rhamnosyltransferase